MYYFYIVALITFFNLTKLVLEKAIYDVNSKNPDYRKKKETLSN